jgi:hypothetical protein
MIPLLNLALCNILVFPRVNYLIAEVAMLSSRPLRRQTLLVSLCLLCLVTLCGNAISQIASGGYQVPNRSKDRVLVFVHGIYGSTSGTWKAPNGVYWPTLVSQDPQFSGSDVFVAGYPTPYTGNKNNIMTIAAALDHLLQVNKVFSTHRQVIFVCHSLGGLIVKEVLLAHPSYAAQIPFILFYATPSAGSFLAEFSAVFEGDPLLKVMSNSGDNAYLLDLESRWRQSSLHIHRYCAYEKEKIAPKNLRSVITGGGAGYESKVLAFLGGVYVVNPFSATYGCDSDAAFTGIPENHVGIVKPTSQSHPSYSLLLDFYRNTLPQTSTAATSVVRYEEPICAFYGESNSGGSAWNKDEVCPIKNAAQLDPEYQQTSFQCCGGNAQSRMTLTDIPHGLEIQVDGGYFWSVDGGKQIGEEYHLHTYCGPEPHPGPGCNVKVKIIGHYKVTQTGAANPH